MGTPNCTTFDERSSCQVRKQDFSAIIGLQTPVSLSCLIQAALRINKEGLCAHNCLIFCSSSEGPTSDVSAAALPAVAAYLAMS